MQWADLQGFVRQLQIVKTPSHAPRHAHTNASSSCGRASGDARCLRFPAPLQYRSIARVHADVPPGLALSVAGRVAIRSSRRPCCRSHQTVLASDTCGAHHHVHQLLVVVLERVAGHVLRAVQKLLEEFLDFPLEKSHQSLARPFSQFRFFPRLQQLRYRANTQVNRSPTLRSPRM